MKRYQDLQQYKQDWKGVLHEYPENIKAYISSLRNKSYSTIESTIHFSSKVITSSNHTDVSEMLPFSSESNITNGSNSINVSNGSLIFGIDGNSQR